MSKRAPTLLKWIKNSEESDTFRDIVIFNFGTLFANC